MEFLREPWTQTMEAASSRAIIVLTRSGATREGVPYSGAFDRLIEISKSATRVGRRGSALGGLIAQPDTARALAYLREAAISTNDAAFIAVRYLGSETGSAGLALLEEAYCAGLLRSDNVARMIRIIVRREKWDCGPVSQLTSPIGQVPKLVETRKPSAEITQQPMAQTVSLISVDMSLAAMVGLMRKGTEAHHRERMELQRRDPEAAQAQKSPAHAANFLAQDYGPQPSWKLDALADSLVVIALEFKQGDPSEKSQVAEAVIMALAIAGGPIARTERHTPYKGSFDRLVRIAEEGAHRLAISSINKLDFIDRKRALEYYGKYATSMRRAAFSAVGKLADGSSQPEGMEILKRLYLEGSVKEPVARDVMNRIAHNQGWL